VGGRGERVLWGGYNTTTTTHKTGVRDQGGRTQVVKEVGV
jgi:hypothetical protein